MGGAGIRLRKVCRWGRNVACCLLLIERRNGRSDLLRMHLAVQLFVH